MAVGEPLRAAGPAKALTDALLAWYAVARRDLPWRRLPTPYKTLVSELMLQQTGVAVVIPYFQRWLARFPDFEALAAAPESAVTAAWSGLGYYARARHLHRAARAVVDRYGGALPQDEANLRALPGVGPYTAAAVAAIAFGRRAFALDGNAVRVVARLCGVESPVDTPAVRARLSLFGLTLVPTEGSGDLVQAVMELGATVCRPRSPDCPRCPVVQLCRAARDGTTDAIPFRVPRTPKQHARWAALRVWSRREVAVDLRAQGLLAGTWMLPVVPRAAADGARIIGAPGAPDAPDWRELLGAAPAKAPQFVASVRHVFTHRELTVEVFDHRVSGRERDALTATGAGKRWRWIEPPGSADLALSSLARKLLAC